MKIIEVIDEKDTSLKKIPDLKKLKKLTKLSQRDRAMKAAQDALVVGPFRPDNHQIELYRGWDGKEVDPTKVLFIGPNAKGYDKEKANLAREMYQSGQYDRRDIWLETQTILGPDGVFRQEISDHNSFLTTVKEGTYKLQDLFKHPTLYKNYPQLKNMKVQIKNNPDQAYHGYFLPNANTISLNMTSKADDGQTYQFSEQYLHNILIHEVQHAIQDQEPYMDPGSNTDQMAANTNKVNKEMSLQGLNPSFNPYTMYRSVAGEAGARESAYRQALDDYERYKHQPNIGRDTDTLTVKGKKIYDVPGDEQPGIGGSDTARGYTYTTGDGQYTTYANPNVELDYGYPLDTAPTVGWDNQIKPTVQNPRTGKPGTLGVDI